VKILINLQAGSVRVSGLRNTLCIHSKAVSAEDLPGNHRGVVPAFFGEGLLGRRLTVGMCSTGIDFQLGTNAADSNGTSWAMQTRRQKKISVGGADHGGQGWPLREQARSHRRTGPIAGASLLAKKPSVATKACSHAQRQPAYPQSEAPKGPKKRIDITG
jgi:hypothetical protein